MIQNGAKLAEDKQEIQVKSAKRVREHGEVLTAQREVQAMLDLVKNESERIDSRFLEPACGDGNFLVAILERKLKTVYDRYKSKKADFEIYMISAVSSIYGIDLLADNIEESKQRMLDICLACYKKALKKKADEEYQNILKFILDKNIVQGDSLNGIDKILFTQWTLVGYQFKREVFSFSQLNQQAEILNTPLFASLISDKGEDVYIPQPIKEYPLTYYKDLGEKE
jgi:hypothetical protein